MARQAVKTEATAYGVSGLDRAELVLRLRLIRSRRVGPVTFHRLVSEHGSAGAALAALPEIARAAGVEGYSVCPVEVAEQELTLGRLAGAQLLAHDGPGYPDAMRDLPDAPPLLWARGRGPVEQALGRDGGRAECLIPRASDGAALGRNAG